MNRISILLVLIFSSTSALACNQYMSINSPIFSPLNFQFNPVGFDNGGLNKTEFDQTLEFVYQYYQPIFENRGANLVFPESNWGNSAVNGTVNRDGDNWEVLVYGGYARHELATVDALLFITCHEIGHHLGETAYYGAPYEWAAAEGQADYYSTLKCMRHVLEDQDNEMVVEELDVPDYVVDRCEHMWETSNDQFICQRSAMAGYQMTQIWDDGSGEYEFETPSQEETNETYIHHPEHQCRIDIYLQGALCEADHSIDMDADDFHVGTCTEAQGHDIGLRPSCWFNESNM